MTAAHVLDAARAHGLMIVTAESCTGGMVAAALTDIAGSSDVFERGFVTYSNAAKQEMLGVRSEALAQFGAVSEEVAREMAEGALARSDAQLAVSITGIAGPGGSEFKPEGLVCFGFARSGHATRCETQEFGPRGRDWVRKAARDHALFMLLSALG
ncbi:CinA family protein [Aquicoccus sp.]|uniref:CinA family protein n=1 Tax=Aquicoccus sp. TaxID=2055851 RepID=UPI003567D273